MEVHKHPHHVTHKKKWTEYLLEFFMLFLAVFLGFIAENIREGHVEKNREHEYIESLVSDLKKDTANAQIVIADFQKNYPFIDSMLLSFPSMMTGDSAAIKVYLRNSPKANAFEDFHITDATMQQLKNSGSLRLIRNKKVVDSILTYDNLSKDALQEEDNVDRKFVRFWEQQNECIDYIKLAGSFKGNLSQKTVEIPQTIFSTNDRSKLNSFYTSLRSLRNIYNNWTYYLSEFKKQSTRLITYLQKEYHLQNE